MIIFKLSAAVLVFIAGLIGGLFPIYIRYSNRSEHLLYYGDYFARGVFLSAALIHLLPEAVFSYQKINPQTHYPIIFLLCVTTMFIIQIIEQYTHKLAAQTAFAQHWTPYLLLVLLSIHSIIAGAALGISSTVTSMLMLFIAIISHKSAAAFALGISMHKHKIAKHVMISLLVLFSLMTPIGIISNALIIHMINSHQAQLMQTLFGGIAAGTFLYIASFKTNDLEYRFKKKSNLLCTAFFGSGIAVMSLVALLV